MHQYRQRLALMAESPALCPQQHEDFLTVFVFRPRAICIERTHFVQSMIVFRALIAGRTRNCFCLYLVRLLPIGVWGGCSQFHTKLNTKGFYSRCHLKPCSIQSLIAISNVLWAVATVKESLRLRLKRYKAQDFPFEHCDDAMTSSIDGISAKLPWRSAKGCLLQRCSPHLSRHRSKLLGCCCFFTVQPRSHTVDEFPRFPVQEMCMFNGYIRIVFPTLAYPLPETSGSLRLHLFLSKFASL